MKQEYKIDELLSDETFIDWMRKGRPVDNHWHQVYLENESLQQSMPDIEKLIQSIVIRNERITSDRKQRIKESINRKIEQKPVYVYVPEYPRYSVLRNIAAAAIIFFVFYLGYQKINLEQSPEVTEIVPEYIVRTTGPRERPVIKLSDGTKVTLNAHSQIRHEKSFSDTARVIELEGEAFFEVSRNIHKPFIVISNGIATKALGTSFNINTRSPGSSVNVTLVTGMVEVSCSAADHGPKVLLTPAQQVDFNTENGQFSKVKNADLAKVLAWKDNLIQFNKASRDEVFAYLSEWYGVSIVQKNTNVMRWEYTGKFQNETLINILNSIGYVKGFQFELNNDTVIIYDN
ncbi:MAG: FecR domain-containing protein [Cyclobacteriaceae bacterium]|nr:FecR domain-containing protein [Cyclobacteriaceae bacterium]